MVMGAWGLIIISMYVGGECGSVWEQERDLNKFELYHERKKFDFSIDVVLSTVEWCVANSERDISSSNETSLWRNPTTSKWMLNKTTACIVYRRGRSGYYLFFSTLLASRILSNQTSIISSSYLA